MTKLQKRLRKRYICNIVCIDYIDEIVEEVSVSYLLLHFYCINMYCTLVCDTVENDLSFIK